MSETKTPAAAEPSSTRNAPRVQFGHGVIFTSAAEAMALAKSFAYHRVGPARSNEGSMTASMLKGQALGIDPITSISHITFTNGRAAIMGDLALALVRRSGKLASFEREWFGTAPQDGFGCKVKLKRSDTGEAIEYIFTVAEAKVAGLYRTQVAVEGSSGVAVWVAWVKRMVYYRALGFALRDLFGDVLMGLYIAEELEEAPPSVPGHEEPPAPAGPDPFLDPTPAEVQAAQDAPGATQAPPDESRAVEAPSVAPAAEPAREAAVPEDVPDDFLKVQDIPAVVDVPAPVRRQVDQGKARRKF